MSPKKAAKAKPEVSKAKAEPKKKSAATAPKAKEKGKKDDDAIPALAPEQVALYSKQWERFGLTKSSDQKDSLEFGLALGSTHCTLYLLLMYYNIGTVDWGS